METKRGFSLRVWLVLCVVGVFLGTGFGWGLHRVYQAKQHRENIQQPLAPSSAIQKSAIQRAVELEKEEDKVRKSLKACNVIPLIGIVPITAKNFLNRLEKNKKLADACLRAKSAGVLIFLTDKFWFSIDPGAITIDSRATDEEIIKFLTQ